MKRKQIMAGALLASLVILPCGQSVRRLAAATTDGQAATRDNVLSYIRETYVVPDSVKLTLGPFRDSATPGYYDCTVTADDGKQPRTQNISVSKDGRILAMSALYPLGPDAPNDMLRIARETLRPPATLQLSLSPLRDSDLPNFLQATLTLDDGKKKQTFDCFVTRDRHYFVLGSVFPLLSPAEVRRTISTRNRPSEGSVRAPVTIVEYADLECPTCARLHEFFEKQLVPKYGDKVRVVYKEFPLPLHDWARTAAVATQCAYQISPGAFVEYRGLIFGNQANINVTNVRDQLLGLGEQAGVDRVKLAACIDSGASVPRVEEDLHEGRKLELSRTPTSFVNGKLMVGLKTPEAFYKAVDEALHAAVPTRPALPNPAR